MMSTFRKFSLVLAFVPALAFADDKSSDFQRQAEQLCTSFGGVRDLSEIAAGAPGHKGAGYTCKQVFCRTALNPDEVRQASPSATVASNRVVCISDSDFLNRADSDVRQGTTTTGGRGDGSSGVPPLPGDRTGGRGDGSGSNDGRDGRGGRDGVSGGSRDGGSRDGDGGGSYVYTDADNDIVAILGSSRYPYCANECKSGQRQGFLWLKKCDQTECRRCVRCLRDRYGASIGGSVGGASGGGRSSGGSASSTVTIRGVDLGPGVSSHSRGGGRSGSDRDGGGRDRDGDGDGRGGRGGGNNNNGGGSTLVVSTGEPTRGYIRGGVTYPLPLSCFNGDVYKGTCDHLMVVVSSSSSGSCEYGTALSRCLTAEELARINTRTGDCVECRASSRGKQSFMSGLADFAAVVAPPLAQFGIAALWSHQWGNAQEDWANAAVAGMEQCRLSQQDYLTYLQTNELPGMTPEQKAAQQCNGYQLGAFAGVGYGNGLGGYSNGFLGGMIGPYGLGGNMVGGGLVYGISSGGMQSGLYGLANGGGGLVYGAVNGGSMYGLNNGGMYGLANGGAVYGMANGGMYGVANGGLYGGQCACVQAAGCPCSNGGSMYGLANGGGAVYGLVNGGNLYGGVQSGMYGLANGGGAIYGMVNGGNLYGGVQSGMYGLANGGMYGVANGGMYGVANGGMYGLNNGGMYGLNNGGMYGVANGGMYGVANGGMYGGQYNQNMQAAYQGSNLQQQALAEQFGVAGQNLAAYGGFNNQAAMMPGNLGYSLQAGFRL